MKFLTIALFVGAISATEFEEIEDELADLLKISVSKKGQKVIEKEAKDVK